MQAATETNSVPRTVSVSEFCRLVGVGQTFVYELLRDGKLRSIKFGKRRLILASEIDRILGETT